MALFTDGSISSIEDLTAQDSQLLMVASVEGINVTEKIALAQEEIGLELQVMLRALAFGETRFGVSAPDLASVAITPGLARWHAYRALEMVYGDAYHNQLNDRYGAKRDQFHQMASWAREKLMQIGIGIVTDAVPKAGPPVVTAVPGSFADGTYFVTMSWVNAAGEEGASATPAVITTTASTLVVEPGAPPPAATGWNVYVGHAPETMVRQNGPVLEIGSVWRPDIALASTGAAPGAGQKPKYTTPAPRILQRG